MRPRYAIYYAPAADAELTRLAAAWLGRDAFEDRAVDRIAPAALADLDLDALTEDPRFYGFHATLKAPFELADDAEEGDLLAVAEVFAAGRTPFTAAIAPQALGRFLALRPTEPDQEIQALHEACVEAFDPFRAPLSPFDLERRRKARLTPEQDARLVRWGYPYVFEDFRFHMTLTGSIADEALRGRILAALTDHFAAVSGPHRFDGIAIFRQEGRETPFRVLSRVAFQADLVSA